MRVIAGSLGGRHFRAPDGHRTHPMSDKVRGALFNTLGDIDGLAILDAFSGSGAVAIEAASRGASRVTAVERDARAHECIKGNLAELGIANVKLQRASLRTWLQAHPTENFDIVIADPPYDDPQPELIERVIRCVSSGGLLVLSWPLDYELPRLDDCHVIRDKTYAAARLLFYRC